MPILINKEDAAGMDRQDNQPPLPWFEIPEDKVETITLAALREYYIRPCLKAKTRGECPVCGQDRVYFGQGLCGTCFNRGKLLIGQELLDVMLFRARNPSARKKHDRSRPAGLLDAGVPPAVQPLQETLQTKNSVEPAPNIKKSIILDYGSDELELRHDNESLDLIIRQGGELVWDIKGIRGDALTVIKNMLGNINAKRI